jgi:hypothetical protein
MIQALRLAYGPVADAVIERRCRGVVRAAQLLGTGADALACIYAVLIGFPEIAPKGMAKLEMAASLLKSNPDWEDEPRVPAGNPDGGQWTADGTNADGSSESRNTNVAMSRECEEEWATARLRCREYQLSGRLGRRSGFGRTYEKCVRGQVSAACGGNAIG